MKIILKVDKRTCIAAQSCVIEDPEHFTMNDYEGKAEVRKTSQAPSSNEVEVEATEKQLERYIQVAKLCPTQAIMIFDEHGTQLFP